MAAKHLSRQVWLAAVFSFSYGYASYCHALAITLTTNDASGKSSFISNAATTTPLWSDGNFPASGNTYTTTGNETNPLAPAGFQLRTPNTASNVVNTGAGGFIFAGDSLTIGDGLNTYTTANLPRLGLIGTLAGPNLITIDNLILNNGGLFAGVSGTTYTVAGNISVSAGGAVIDQQSTSRSIIITAPISGVGAILFGDATVTSAPSGAQLAAFTGINLTTANTYGGGTTIKGGTTVYIKHDGGLGSGNVTLAGNPTTGATPVVNAFLTLTGGTTNDYIADSASLILASNLAAGGVILNFSGTDVIGGISFDDGTTFGLAGTYGAVGSGATFTSTDFTGTGLLQVIPTPEPASLCTMGMASVTLLGRRSGRRR